VGVIRRRPNKHPLTDNWKHFLSVNPISMLDHFHIRNYRNNLLRLMNLKDFEKWLIEESEFYDQDEITDYVVQASQ